MFSTAMALGAFIGPVIAGNIANRWGYQSFFWLCASLTAVTLLMILFCFPETMFERESEIPQLSPDSIDNAKLNLTKSELDAKKPETDTESMQHVENRGDNPLLGKGQPSRKQFYLIQRPHHLWRQYLIRDIAGPLRASILPIVLFASVNVMGAANLTLFWNVTQSSILRAPPYNFTPAQVGFANFGLAGGAILGMLTAGPLSDWIVKRSTIRNHGLREAEMRLPALIPFAIVCVVGTVIGGIAVRDKWGWPVIVVVAFGTAGLSVASIPAIVVAYALDVYRPIAGEILIVATVFKNTTGFGMTKWVPPMVVKNGYMLPLMIWFIFTIGPILLAIPFYFWGKKLRTSVRFRGHPATWQI